MSDQSIILLGTIILFAGMILAIAALFFGTFQRTEGTRKSGAVIIIGPFPIVLGNDPRIARQLLVLAIVLLVALIVFYLVQIL